MGRPSKLSSNVVRHESNAEREARKMVEEVMEEISKVSVGIDNYKVPTYMSKDGKAEFKRIKPLLENVALTELDFSSITGYLNAFSMYTQAQRELSKSTLLIEKTVKGVVTQVENPLVKIIKTSAEEMRKFSSLIGLTYNSRYQIATNKVADSQSSLEEEFDI